MEPNRAQGMKETRRHGDETLPVMCYRIHREDGFSALDCHWHEEMELFRVLQGVVTVQCGAALIEAKEGDILFFNSGELHAAVPADDAEDLYFEAIVFSPEFLCGDLNDAIRVKYVAPVLTGEHSVPGCFPAGSEENKSLSAVFDVVCRDIFERGPFFEFRVKSAMLSAFGVLAAAANPAQHPAKHSAGTAGVKTAIEYIQKNFRSVLTVTELARLSGMSEGHFCRVFKQYTLKTPVQFINGVRLAHAVFLLGDPSRRVIDVALDSGFNSVSYFIEVFRENFGVTPSRYRKAS